MMRASRGSGIAGLSSIAEASWSSLGTHACPKPSIHWFRMCFCLCAVCHCLLSLPMLLVTIVLKHQGFSAASDAALFCHVNSSMHLCNRSVLGRGPGS